MYTMLYNILIIINKYSTSLASINTEYKDMYSYEGTVHSPALYRFLTWEKSNGEFQPAYNWRNKTLLPVVSNQMYSIINGDTIRLECLLPTVLRTGIQLNI